MKKLLTTLLTATAVAGSLFALTSCEAKTYELALITDVGDINDKSFNQTSWEALRDYAEEKNCHTTIIDQQKIQMMQELNQLNKLLKKVQKSVYALVTYLMVQFITFKINIQMLNLFYLMEHHQLQLKMVIKKKQKNMLQITL